MKNPHTFKSDTSQNDFAILSKDMDGLRQLHQDIQRMHFEHQTFQTRLCNAFRHSELDSSSVIDTKSCKLGIWIQQAKQANPYHFSPIHIYEIEHFHNQLHAIGQKCITALQTDDVSLAKEYQQEMTLISTSLGEKLNTLIKIAEAELAAKFNQGLRKF